MLGSNPKICALFSVRLICSYPFYRRKTEAWEGQAGCGDNQANRHKATFTEPLPAAAQTLGTCSQAAAVTDTLTSHLEKVGHREVQ